MFLLSGWVYSTHHIGESSYSIETMCPLTWELHILPRVFFYSENLEILQGSLFSEALGGYVISRLPPCHLNCPKGGSETEVG
ncbi:hypothetical protein FKM82_021439 [Ascaphus truei]